VRDEWNEFMPTVYPIVPGHEIVGRVAKVGSAVKKLNIGDLAGVGCLVDSDRTCPRCRNGDDEREHRLLECTRWAAPRAVVAAEFARCRQPHRCRQVRQPR